MVPGTFAWLGNSDRTDDAAFWWWAIPLFLGAFVFTACAVKEPHWLLGAGFGFVLGAIEAALFMWHNVGSPVNLFLVITSVFAGAMGAVAGMMGGSLAVDVTHHAAKSGGRLRRLKPWHFGVAVLLIDLVAAIVWSLGQ